MLEPTEKICWDWHVGWIVNGKGYVSRISIGEEVRMLGGNRDTKWFALGNDGQQKKLVCRRQGKIGDGSYLGLIPLL